MRARSTVTCSKCKKKSEEEEVQKKLKGPMVDAEPEPAATARGERYAEEFVVSHYGTAQSRMRNWIRFCGEHGEAVDQEAKSVIATCRAQTGSETDTDAVLRSWTSNALYQQVNKAVLQDSTSQLRRHGGYIRALRRSMRNNVDAGHNVQSGIVWRSMNVDNHAAYKVGWKFLMQSILSTSRNRSVAEMFGNTLFRIDLSGVGLTYAVDIAYASVYPDEEEVLVYPYSGFEVVGRDRMADGRWMISLRTYDTVMIDTTHGVHACPIGPMPELT